MLDDARYALRSFRRKPLVALVAVLTLGLGIGGATAVFSVVDAVILRAIPFDAPDRLVRVWDLTREGDRFSMSERAFVDLAETSRTLEPIAAYKDPARVVLVAGEPQSVVAASVSAAFDDVLRLEAQVGRLLTEEDDRPGTPGRVVLSDGLWRSRFNGAPDVVGRVVTIDGAAFTIAGVMPPNVDFPGRVDLWRPLAANANADPTDKALAVIARLAPGATLAQAKGELRDIAEGWSARYPEAHGGWSADVVPFSEWIIAPRFRDAVWVLFGAVVMLLLLGCANIANLLVAQAASRQGEMRVRSALGAARVRLLRQLLTESAVLAAAGTGAGVLVAVWSVDLVSALAGGLLPRLDNLRVDAPVLLFACGVGAMSCFVFGLTPALYASRIELRGGLEQGTRVTSRMSAARRAAVVVEVALALLLLVGAGLLGTSFVRLMQVDPGFDVDAALAIPIEHGSPRYTDARIDEFSRDVLDRLRGIAGVVAAGATATNPLRQFGFSNNVTPEERAAEAPASGLVQAGWRSVTPGFLEAMGIPLIAGRTFTDADRDGAERVVIVSQGLARRLWPDQSPIGKRIYWGGTTGRPRTVIGVSGDIRDVQLDAEPQPLLFVPHAQVPMPGLTIVLRTWEPMERIAPLIRQRIREVDPGLPAPPIYPLAASRADATVGPRFNLSLLAAFAGIALVLAMTGVYGVLAYTVSERRREMAVRLALGASHAQLSRLILRSGLTLAMLGAILGLAAALATTRVLSRLLYDVAPTDPTTLGAATIVLLAAAALASWWPARQAARVDAAALLNRGA